ncbi:MAG TPA: hypothetical protein VFZ00_08015 [Solirubrobacter sp.]|nr:hypothetical protein [Solirubrobacter sp.]
MALPGYRIGWQIFTFSGTAWSTLAQAQTTLNTMYTTGVVGLEGASGRYAGFPHTAAGMNQYADFAVANNIRLVGDHNGPAPSSAANTALAVAKMAAWERAGNARALGVGGGTPGENAGATQAAQLTNVSAYINHANNMNINGQRYQNGFTPGVSDSLPGARWYQHMHREWKTYHLLPSDHKYFMKRQAEILFDPEDGVDEAYAFIEIDLAWIHEGIRQDSVTRGLGWTQAEIADETVRVMGLYGDRSPFFHVKDVTATGGAANTGDALGDLVPFQRIFQQLRHPASHEYLVERDGAGNNWPTVMSEAGAFLRNLRLDRSLVGAPANVDRPVIDGSGKAGKQLVRNSGGTWVREANEHGRTYQWLRDGIPIAGATGTKYMTSRQDAGRDIQLEVTSYNDDGSTIDTSNLVTLTEAVAVNLSPPVLSGSGAIGSKLHVSPGEWEGPGSYSYVWKADGAVFETEKANQYVVTAADAGKSIVVEVTKGDSEPAASNAVVAG